MSDRSYEHDALSWAEHQAGLLRRLAAGERLNEEIDWENVIEEVHDVGVSQLRSCRSLLRQAIVHLLKLHAWPGSRSAGHWRSETIAFLGDSYDCFSPSMRQRIDLQDEYDRASRQVQPLEDDSGPARPHPVGCPFELDNLLAGNPDIDALVHRLGGPERHGAEP